MGGEVLGVRHERGCLPNPAVPDSHHARYVRSWRFAPPHARARSMLSLRKLHECSSAVGASKSGLRVGGRRGARGPYRGLQAAWRPDCAPLPPMQSKIPREKSRKWPPLLVCRAPLAANNTISEKRDFPGVRKGLRFFQTGKKPPSFKIIKVYSNHKTGPNALVDSLYFFCSACMH